MLTPTKFESIDSMPDCPYATSSCFCAKHFAAKSSLGRKATSLFGNIEAQFPACPKDRIMQVNSKVYMVDSPFNRTD
jgi:hypothetical protein